MALRDTAARRYAQAAFELAQERNDLDVWERDLNSLREALASEEALAFVSNHKVAPAAKEEFLRRAAGETAPLAWNLVRLLSSKRRLALLPQIAEDFQTLADEARGVAHAHVLAAVPMSEDERGTLARRLSEQTGKRVDVQVNEAPEILGGLVARIGDTLIDGSTRSRLLALRRQLAGAGGAHTNRGLNDGSTT
jgi:F-type H+-transporting ATPase subunit delta